MNIKIWHGSKKGKNKPGEINCQDYSESKEFENNKQRYYILAVADGHGHVKYDLSDQGAKLAVESAFSILNEFVTGTGSEEIGSIIDAFKKDIPRKISKEWRDKVKSDMNTRGFASTQNEIQFYRYGTTLLCALILYDEKNSIALCCQIGDGDIVYITESGEKEIISQRDSKLMGSETHSLSASNAVVNMYTYQVTNLESGLFALSTDGVSDSFSSNSEEGLLKWMTAIYDRINQYGFDPVMENMPGWLSDLSEKGSGDDISVSLAYLSVK